MKEKLRTHTGTPVEHQRLILRSDGRDICEMSDNKRMLGFYSVESGMEIYIIGYTYITNLYNKKLYHGISSNL